MKMMKNRSIGREFLWSTSVLSFLLKAATPIRFCSTLCCDCYVAKCIIRFKLVFRHLCICIAGDESCWTEYPRPYTRIVSGHGFILHSRTVTIVTVVHCSLANNRHRQNEISLPLWLHAYYSVVLVWCKFFLDLFEIYLRSFYNSNLLNILTL